MKTRVIYVVDDDEAARESLKLLLEVSGHTVETFESAVQFLETARPGPGDCVISDVKMPGMTGFELLVRLKASHPSLPVLLITGHGDIPLAVEAMRAGASDFIEKPFDHRTILGALERLDRKTDPGGESGALRERVNALTQRERQVLEGLVAGKPNKAVARDLAISPRTVEVYRANLMTKMQASSFSELIRIALAAGAAP